MFTQVFLHVEVSQARDCLLAALGGTGSDGHSQVAFVTTEGIQDQGPVVLGGLGELPASPSLVKQTLW